MSLTLPIGVVQQQAVITAYSPGMMAYDGSTGYYSKAATVSGNKVSVLFQFNRASFTGASFEFPMSGYGASGQQRPTCVIYSSDHATTANRSKLQFQVKNSAGTTICSLFSINAVADSADHFVHFAFDGDLGTATFEIDGVDADDTGHGSRVAPTTGTLDTGAGNIFVGVLNGSPTAFYGGEIGYFGYADSYLTNTTDFYSGDLQELDTSTWTEFGSQPLAFAPDGKLDTNNLGSLGAFTKTGTITGPA